MSAMQHGIAIVAMWMAPISEGAPISGDAGAKSLWCFCADQTPMHPAQPECVTKSHELKEGMPRETPIERLPFVMVHDFGKLKHGTKASHTFCFENSSGVVLRVVSVRASSANHLRANMSKLELQPGEEGKLEISIDTQNFVGRKTTRVFLILQYGGKRTETFVRVTAESISDSEP
jgi:hypothetical protein